MIIGTAAIVCSWTCLPLISWWQLWMSIVLTVLGGILDFFALLFFVYFFNLDSKLLSKLPPLFNKIYNKRKRNKEI